jgi:hypothetical protein
MLIHSATVKSCSSQQRAIAGKPKAGRNTNGASKNPTENLNHGNFAQKAMLFTIFRGLRFLKEGLMEDRRISTGARLIDSALTY